METLEILYEDRINITCTDKHKRILTHYVLWSEFLINKFSYILPALNTIKLTHIDMLQNICTTESV